MKKQYLIMALLVLGLGSQSAVAAKLYKWVDEFGNVTYRDTPPLEAGTDFEEKNFKGGSGGSSEITDEATDAAQGAPVVLYRTSSCSACDSAADYMRSRGVPFEEKNVEGNGELQQELKAKAGELSVPTILVGEKVMRGYVQSLLEGELDAVGYPKAGQVEQGAGEEAAAGETGETPEPPEEVNPTVQ